MVPNWSSHLIEFSVCRFPSAMILDEIHGIWDNGARDELDGLRFVRVSTRSWLWVTGWERETGLFLRINRKKGIR